MKSSASERAMESLEGCPRHVAIIMDGNNRWARSRGLKGAAGHRAGVASVRAAVETCGKSGVEVLTLFAFSSENWRRPEDEVGALMTLFLRALKREVKRLERNNIRLMFIGSRERFSETLQQNMREAEQATAHCTDMTLVVAADYGGRWDIARASRRIAEDVSQGRLSPAEVDESLFGRYMSLADFPMPDLLVRTGGETRISNFLLWQFAYTEFYFSPVYWPDFQHDEMRAALEDFAGRQRRFGQTSEQVSQLESAARSSGEPQTTTMNHSAKSVVGGQE